MDLKECVCVIAMKRKRENNPFKWDNGSSASISAHKNASVRSSSSYSSGDDHYHSSDSQCGGDDDGDIPIGDDSFNRTNMIDQLLNTMKTAYSNNQPQQQKQQPNGRQTTTTIKVAQIPRPRKPLNDVFTAFSNTIMNDRILPKWESSSSSSSSDSGDEEEMDEFSTQDSDSDVASSSIFASKAMTMTNRHTAAATTTTTDIIAKDKGNIFDNIFAGLTGEKGNTNASEPKKNTEGCCGQCRKKTGSYDKRHRGECFMCAWGNLYHDGIEAKHVAKMNTIMNNYGGCDNIELAQQLVLYYKQFVYRKHTGLPMFTIAVALEHIENHILSAKIFAGESIRMWLQIRFLIANNLFDDNGRHDKHDLQGLINVQKILNTSYGLNPANMLFDFGDSKDDMKKMGQNFKFMEMFKQRDDRIQNRINRSDKSSSRRKKAKTSHNHHHHHNNNNSIELEEFDV